MITYPEDLFESIEFDLVKEAVAKHAVTERARERILGLKPSADFAQTVADLAEVNEVLGLYQSDFPVPALASEDIKHLLLRLKIQGAMLEGEDFLVIKSMVESFNRVYRFFKQHAERTPSIQSKLAHVAPNKEVPDEIDRVLDRRGVVKTSASVELGKIRASLTKKRAAADRIFYRAAKKYQNAGVLADIQESVHDNKRVLAIEGAFKGQVNGIFHGSSAKATIFFVEPAETLEVNNEIALLEDEERREITRILRILTAFVAGYREVLRDFSTALYEIDFVNAKALHALAEEACLPQLSEKPHVHLIRAINPVLRRFNKNKEKPVVPLDIRLDRELRILVISGPNAGGKSITLKTVGLLQLMLQSGLLVTVHPDSTMGWFNGIMADIGDAQSMENELSTYSSKLAKMNYFLNAAYGKTLVLIDEFGSGSDPDLGSSMAQVFLRELNRSKTFGVMTTHYNSIKALAGQLQGVENGSMQFNSTDLSPEYVLNQGVPGSSYTYEVAQKVGVRKELIDQARAVLDERTVAVDRLLVSIQKEKNLLADQRVQLQARLEELEKLEAKQARKIAQLEDKVSRQAAMNEQQNAMITWGKKFQSLVNEYSEARSKKDKNEVLGRFRVYAGDRAEQTADERNQKKTRYQKEQEKKIQELTSKPVAVGDRVKLIGSRQAGEVVEIKKDQYLLAIGALTTWASRDKFIPAESLHGDPGTPKGKARGGVREPEKPEPAAEPASEAPAKEHAKEHAARGEGRAAKKQAKKSEKSAAAATPAGKRKRKSKPKPAADGQAKTGAQAVTGQKASDAENAPAPKSTEEKLAQAAQGKPLVQPKLKKSTGRAKEPLSEERQRQLDGAGAPQGPQGPRKMGSKTAAANEEPRDATNDDLEKLKAFFSKK